MARKLTFPHAVRHFTWRSHISLAKQISLARKGKFHCTIQQNHPDGWFLLYGAVDGTFLLRFKRDCLHSMLRNRLSAQNRPLKAPHCGAFSDAAHPTRLQVPFSAIHTTKPPRWVVLVVWCGRWDLNPYACAHAPQTCLSANSSTTANKNYYTVRIEFCQPLF